MGTNPYAWSRYKVNLPRTLIKENWTENGNPLILLCYVQERPIPGHEHFVLIANNTLVDINADINFHARASKEIGVLPLRRTTSEAYHYQNKATQHARGEAVLFSAKGHKALAKKASTAAPKAAYHNPKSQRSGNIPLHKKKTKSIQKRTL